MGWSLGTAGSATGGCDSTDELREDSGSALPSRAE